MSSKYRRLLARSCSRALRLCVSQQECAWVIQLSCGNKEPHHAHKRTHQMAIGSENVVGKGPLMSNSTLGVASHSNVRASYLHVFDRVRIILELESTCVHLPIYPPVSPINAHAPAAVPPSPNPPLQAAAPAASPRPPRPPPPASLAARQPRSSKA